MKLSTVTEPIKFDRTMGPPASLSVEKSMKSKRTALALDNVAKGDEKLNRQAEEQILKVRIYTI